VNALEFLMNKIVPLLDQHSFNYCLIVCGKDVPQKLLNSKKDKIIFTGFVNDIYEYYQAADIFLNPVISGGGIKTKLVEALANNCMAISGKLGAIGVPQSLTNEKLVIVPDNDAKAFADAIINSPVNHTDVPPAFFKYFNADFIAIKLNNALLRLKADHKTL
jgi:glycosyltransferase involved in cell wall biosynthesis